MKFALLPALLLSASVAHAADVLHYSVNKGYLFAQTNASAPQLKTGLPYLFQPAVVAETNRLNSASMQWQFGSRGFQQRLAPNPYYTSTDRMPTAALLDLFFASGDYTFTMNMVNDGTRVAVLTLPAGVNPPAPTVANYTAAQSINPSNDFTLQWGMFVGGTPNDFIHVRIDSHTNTVFRTAFAPGLPGALNGLATSVLIPSNTLPAGRALAARIIFSKINSTNVPAYPGVTASANYYSQTEFFIATTGGIDVTPPRVISTLPPDGATGVPTNMPLGFHFSESMRQSSSFASTYLNASSVSATKLAQTNDAAVITPTIGWPSGATMGWVLNPSDTYPLFADANNNPLAPESTFVFTLGTTGAPVAQPLLTEPFRLADGRFQFKLLGETNRTYAAQSSTNFTNWVSLGTNVAFGGVIQFTDTNLPAPPHRFYRGLAP